MPEGRGDAMCHKSPMGGECPIDSIEGIDLVLTLGRSWLSVMLILCLCYAYVMLMLCSSLGRILTFGEKNLSFRVEGIDITSCVRHRHRKKNLPQKSHRNRNRYRNRYCDDGRHRHPRQPDSNNRVQTALPIHGGNVHSGIY